MPVSEGMVYVDVAAGRVSHREVIVSAGRESREGPDGAGTLAFIFNPEKGELVEGTIARLRASA